MKENLEFGQHFEYLYIIYLQGIIESKLLLHKYGVWTIFPKVSVFSLDFYI